MVFTGASLWKEDEKKNRSWKTNEKVSEGVCVQCHDVYFLWVVWFGRAAPGLSKTGGCRFIVCFIVNPNPNPTARLQSRVYTRSSTKQNTSQRKQLAAKYSQHLIAVVAVALALIILLTIFWGYLDEYLDDLFICSVFLFVCLCSRIFLFVAFLLFAASFFYFIYRVFFLFAQSRQKSIKMLCTHWVNKQLSLRKNQFPCEIHWIRVTFEIY